MSQKIIISIFAFSLFSVFCPAQESPIIEYDFGKIPHTDIVQHAFEFPQEFKSIVALCDCVKVALYRIRDPDRGLLSVVRVEFDPYDYIGAVQQDIILIDTNDKRMIIRLKALVQVPSAKETKNQKNF
jgi:hypothetical protein